MTQLKEALETAGIRSPVERLKEIAVIALCDNAGSWDGARDALARGYRGDPALVSALMEPYRAMAEDKLLRETARELREADLAREARSRQDRDGAKEGGHDCTEDHEGHAAPSSSAEARRAEARRKGAETMAGKLGLSMLDTFMPEGIPIRNWQAGEARAWARRTGRNVRFVELLTANIPPLDTIGKWITPAMAADFWARSAPVEA